MDDLQQCIFQNFSKNTQYQNSSRKITDRHQTFPKYRREEIQNQFELVDLHKKGKLAQSEIIMYLSDKYQWVNTDILREVFNTMNWDQNNFVTKQQFIIKYLGRQKKLYNEINGLKYYQNWVDTLQQIYCNETNNYTDKPRVYFYVQIRSIQLYYQKKQIQWMDLKAQYENHESKKIYEIQEIMHQSNYPSFEIWLPAKDDQFFLKFQFFDPNNREIMYGQTYINIPLHDKINKMTTMNQTITKNGKNVGYCLIYAYAESSMEKVRDELNQLKSKQRSYSDAIDDKVKQYEYLQFLWGTRQRSPNKIQEMDVGRMVCCRIVLLILLGLLGIVVHVLGRYEPLSLIIMFLMLKTWQFVLLRYQKFLLAWLTILAMLLDIIWVSICTYDENHNIFIPQSPTFIATYGLFGIKIVLLTYLLFFERSLSSN